MALPPPQNKREELHEILVSCAGSRNVYFQPPPDLTMQYPAIVYEQDFLETVFANNNPYRRTKRYQVTVIDRNPDTLISDKVAALPLCSFTRAFASDGLNHYIYSLYF